MERVTRAGLQVAAVLADFVETEALPGTGVAAGDFWEGLAGILQDLAPVNRALLAKRDRLQTLIDEWHRANGAPSDMAAYRGFLSEIGYLVPEGPDFSIETAGVDPEIAGVSGPQLVVPVMNRRFALNAANARWGSLYDALYGTDAIPESERRERGTGYNPARGAAVIAWARAFLDDAAPLEAADWSSARRLAVVDGALEVALGEGRSTGLARPGQFVGYLGEPEAPRQIIMVNNGLHLGVVIDDRTATGADDAAHISDVLLEAAITAIMDCEDSIAAVDAEDKVEAYRNWLGLMQGDLSEPVTKGGRSFVRRLNPDAEFIAADGSTGTLRSRALMLVRNVGHLMTNPAILDASGEEVPEGIMDAAVTALVALHDVGPGGRRANSPAGSVYVVKPKMHGPEEVAFAVALFGRIEAMLGMAPNTLKIGIMDEERRTSVNLKECIRAARDRVVFINTGFLDRTGDEIHTSMEAGPVIPKEEMRDATWYGAYENWNVDVGLACGLAGRAQIGKGMWAMPDLMAAMLAEKGAQPAAGANTAWVPSPTAATLHATHYHRVSVAEAQARLTGKPRGEARRHPDAAGGGAAELVGGGDPGRARQQCPGHPRLCRALDRPGDRLLEGAGHPRCRADGGSGDAADLVAAHGQLAPARDLHPGAGDGDAGADGRRRRRPERRRSGLPADGAGLRRIGGVPGGVRPRLRGGAAAERLYRADPACPAAGAKGAGVGGGQGSGLRAGAMRPGA